ncbi:MAG TPA: DUF2231 domain-containing protein [Pseudomonas sp.]|nr:DUF2231 domain-containing protein [Pseudomonas sp.]
MTDTTTTYRTHRNWPNPLHATLLAGTVPLFLGALLSDIAYYRSFHIQWSNFASWLIAGGLVFCGLAILFALAGMLRAGRKPRSGLYLALLVATWILGFLDALHHARDAWATMPAGLVLSVIVLVLACLATWAGLSEPRTGGER